VKTKYTYGTSCMSVIAAKDNQKLFPDIVIVPSNSNEFNILNCLTTPKRLSTPPVQWWDQVRVIGELKANNKISNHADVIFQVAGYVRQIFQNQHSRVFVHAFTLCGDLLRAWIFDRSGCLGSQLISINKEPELFLRVFCGYATMDAKDIGFDPTIRWIPRQALPSPSPTEDGCDGNKGDSDDGGTDGKQQHLWLLPYNPGEETVYDPTVAAAANAECFPWLDQYNKHPNIWKSPLIPYPFIYITEPTGSSSILDASNLTPDAGHPTPDPGASIRTKMFIKPQVIFSSRAIVSRGTVIWAGRTVDTPCADWNYAIKDQWRHTDRVREATQLQAAREAGVMNVARHIYDEDLGSISTVVRRGLRRGGCKVIQQLEQGPLITIGITSDPIEIATDHSRKRHSGSPPVEPPSSKKLKSQNSGPIMPPPPFPILAQARRPSCTTPPSTSQPTSGSQSRVLGHKVGNTALGSKDRERSRLVMSPLGKDLTKFQSFTELLLVFRDSIEGKFPSLTLSHNEDAAHIRSLNPLLLCY